MAVLEAHSRDEARQYVALARCRRCRGGPLEPIEFGPADPKSTTLDLTVFCARCGAESQFQFTLLKVSSVAAGGETIFSSFAEPSRILDLADWLTLYALREDAASNAEDRANARNLRLQGTACLKEALKFFGHEPEHQPLPPETAFFREESKARFIQNPQHYARERIVGMLSKQPHGR